MGTILKERAVTNSISNFLCHEKPRSKGPGRSSSGKKCTKRTEHPQRDPAKDSMFQVENVSQTKGRRTRTQRTSVTGNTTVCAPRQVNPKYQVSCTFGVKEKNQRQKNQCNREKDQNEIRSKNTSNTPSLPLTHVRSPSQDNTDNKKQNENSVSLKKQREDPTDSDSDLSDTEKHPMPPSTGSPPHLNLRAEVISPCDFQCSLPRGRGHSYVNMSYPDFLPPPFNSWNLRQLAVFLNTDGRDSPRPRPVGQLERYLDRLLQLEWHQIQTVQEESGKSDDPVSVGRRRSRSTSNLSSPKSILQCQRAFPLTLLSSLVHTSTAHLLCFTCLHCQSRSSVCAGTCRTSAHRRHSRLSPVLERRRQVIQSSKRSSSESRVHLSEQSLGHQGQRQTNVNSYFKRMQAVGNIRIPVGPSSNSKPGSSNVSTKADVTEKLGTGDGNSLCKEFTEDVSRRKSSRVHGTAVAEQDSKPDRVQLIRDDLQTSVESVLNRTSGTMKRVGFVTN